MQNALPLIASFVGPVRSNPAKKKFHHRVEKREVDEGNKRVRVVVFSKDRPVQLRWLLSSMKRYVVGVYDVVVLWRSSYSYDKVRSEFPDVAFKEEGDLKALLLESIDESIERTMFCVDDVVFYRRVDLDSASKLPRDVLGFQFKLNPHVCWSHPAESPCPPPRFSAFERGELEWTRSEGQVDWDYGWDLCCSLYRTIDVKRILSETMGDLESWHPNTIEARGSKCRLLERERPKSKCYAIPVASVITINRVQDVYRAPVYGSASLRDLNDQRRTLDDDFYRDNRFDSAHIGLLVFQREKRIVELPSITVVMPARNAASTIIAALKSIERQRSSRLRVYVVVVDDNSTDDTFDVVSSYAMSDLKIVRNSRKPGVSGALNHGLGLVRTQYVARLDADDECYGDDRLETQVRYLEAHMSVGVVGGAALSFFDEKERAPRYVGHPCGDPLTVAWSLIFSCHVTHPSIVARTTVLRDVGGYSESERVRHAEDYDLWLRLTERDPRTIANLAEPLVWLRKSSTSVSSQYRDRQKQASIDASTASIRRRLGRRKIDTAVVAALRSPSDVSSPGLLEKAGELLLALENNFKSIAGDDTSCPVDDTSPQPPSSSPSSSRACGLVSLDVDGRLGEMAFLSSSSSSSSSSMARMWAGRSSNQLNRFFSRRP